MSSSKLLFLFCIDLNSVFNQGIDKPKSLSVHALIFYVPTEKLLDELLYCISSLIDPSTRFKY